MSGRNSTNPAIWLVPGAGGIFSSGLLTAGGILALTAWAWVMTLNFHFFCTPTPFTYRGYFSLDKRFGNRIQIKNISLWNVQFVNRFNTAFTIKRGASQQVKQVISERVGERGKKINCDSSVLKKLPSACGLGQQFQGLGHSFSLYGPPSWQITYMYFDNWVHITVSI